MAGIKIYESDQVTVEVYPEFKLVRHTMHQHTYGKDFRDALMAGVKAMKEHGADKWLSDDRENPVLRPDDQKWALEDWQTEVMQAGWKFWAIVQPQHSLAKLRMMNFAEMYRERGLTVELFTEPEKAMEWLKSVDG